MKKTVNWKVSFLVLASFNVILFFSVGILFLMLLSSIDQDEGQMIDETKPEANFTIKTTRDELNQLIALKLKEQPKQVVTYHVFLTNEQIELRTAIPILSRNIEVQVNMIPEVAPNGDLLLHISTLSMGQLQLPQQIVLQMLTDFLSFPPYVNLNPTEQTVHIVMSEITEVENIFFYFEKFDLPNNEIELLMKIE
ncbi:YpmS family protein [Alkalihalobacillus sp. BA299]|uniref:YpmS family protein n=1 Tax=Alkalihalobacillus sp. BA299 TaxID=2815938 RepID=UPI001AD9FBF3|nr:YpmS family protein [Alkalihalobacillus sp. BA299]